MKALPAQPIKSFCVGIYDGPHATPKEAADGPIFLGIKNITENGRLDYSEIRHVSEEEFPTWTRRVTPQPGDVVFTYEATLHRYAVIPDGFRGCLGRRVALVRPDPRKADSRFLLYYFLSHAWRSVIESSIITGATVDRIPLETFPDFPARLPSLDVQRKVSGILSAYDRLIHLHDVLRWDSVYAWNEETFGANGTLGRTDTREVVLTRDLRVALGKLNRDLPAAAIEEAIEKLTRHDFTRSLLQQNQEFYRFIRDGVPVSYRDERGQTRSERARVIDFRDPKNNRFLVVRELKLTGLRTPNYNRRADLVCFVNGLPLVFIELKAVYKNIRAGFDENLRDYLDENVIAHAFHHNALLVVSNGHRARYGTITSDWDHFFEWKRNDEKDRGTVEAQALLEGMLAKDRLLDLVESFILFDASKPGATSKIIARNQQVLGVNNAVRAVVRQEELKREFPPEKRLRYRVVEVPRERAVDQSALDLAVQLEPTKLMLVEPVHHDLGKLGVFWHTQGSGKSYSMAFLTEKVRRTVPGNFTFLLMTDRNELDTQIYNTFAGCGIVDDNTPRASSGERLKDLFKENHRYIFSLIHKFNQDVDPKHPYSRRDDIIVISDEAHRTQAGKLARNMRLALPNAEFIGFTGTPLFKHDHLTKRIFGGYVSRYDFKRSEEDDATVKLVYENRGEKLGIARMDLNDRIAAAVEQADLDPDQAALLQKLLGKDYEVITADDRLDKIAADFVEHCALGGKPARRCSSVSTS
jgi:type I restriction enzyme R subunit